MSTAAEGSRADERRPRNWERIAWVVALIAGVQTAYTTWMTGIQYLNARRDLILGIGQTKCLPPELAQMVFFDDWITSAVGFCTYALLVLGILWVLLVLYKPVQVALLNPFGMPLNEHAFRRKRRWLRLFVSAITVGILIALAATLALDASDTWTFMGKHMCGAGVPAA